MIKIKSLLTQDTLIRPEKNGEKVEVPAGAVVEVSDEQAIYYTATKEFERVTGDVDSENVEKGAVKNDKKGKKKDKKVEKSSDDNSKNEDVEKPSDEDNSENNDVSESDASESSDSENVEKGADEDIQE